MTLVVAGLDALDAELLSEGEYPNLTLDAHSRISTLRSSTGELSTHELWPTIISGVTPEEHGLTLESGLSWESPLLRLGGEIAQYTLPNSVRSKIGAWILNNAEVGVFRTPASYYEKQGVSTLFDQVGSKTIGIPNYVTDADSGDREHELRRGLGELFERDIGQPGGHASADPRAFYEQCMEMVMIRIARIRRAFRSQRHELVFGYTSGVDLIGHVAYNDPALQKRGYEELDDFVGELRTDLGEDDTLVVVSDHGLRDGMHTEAAVIASTEPRIVDAIDSVLDVREALEQALEGNRHAPKNQESVKTTSMDGEADVREHLEDLGYI